VTFLFADTSFYVAVLNTRDVHHREAVDFSIRSNAEVLTTEFILVEVANFSSRVSRRGKVTQFISNLRTDPQTTIIPASTDLVERGFDLFARRPDKEWSLTDCISFVVMEEHGVSEALTTDGHFAQAGFKMLL
jgi:predicted nucleic acid-binding protein